MSEPMLMGVVPPPLGTSEGLATPPAPAGVTVLPPWRLGVLSFVAPGPGGYRLLVCGLALLAGCAAFRELDAPVLSAVEWHAYLNECDAPVPGEVVLTYRLASDQMLSFTLEAADQDELRWTPGEASGALRVRLGPPLDLTWEA